PEGYQGRPFSGRGRGADVCPRGIFVPMGRTGSPALCLGDLGGLGRRHHWDAVFPRLHPQGDTRSRLAIIPKATPYASLAVPILAGGKISSGSVSPPASPARNEGLS